MKILLINPPIYDFTAFDLWSKPLGLLYLSSILKKQNIDVNLLDYMDRHFAEADSAAESVSDEYGCGHYLKTHVPKPAALKNIPRYYSRYGISKEDAESRLPLLKQPDLIIVTSIMTYWYPGVIEAIESVGNVFPNIPVALGGVYATLCPEHAARIKPDFLVQGGLASLNKVFEKFSISAKASKIPRVPESFADFPAPDYTYYNRCGYAALRMSMGCPFKCSYCAQHTLCGDEFTAKSPERVFKEIQGFAAKGIKNITFYDDALLYKADEGIKPLLKKIVKSGIKINIHTPNGLHLRYLDPELAKLMKAAGFVFPRFSLESADARIQKETGAKITNKGFEKAAAMLKEAGFKNGEFLIYLLMGMPGQSLQDVEASVRYVHSHGGKVSLSEYSIIPGTKDFERRFTNNNLQFTINGKDFKNEPLLHNKSVFPLFETKDWKEIMRIKNLATRLNSLL